MAYIITRLCRDCVDMGCVNVCPVDCIYQYTGSDPSFLNQLYIDNTECIDCGACEPECPWQAIFEEEAVPSIFKDDIAFNNKIEGVAERVVPRRPDDKPGPTPDEINANKKKWGYTN